MDIPWTTELTYAGRLLLAVVLGLVIGYERERRRRAAGLRTFGTVALGACLFSIISFVVVPEGRETTRIAAQVVTGIGFLGAGVILHGQEQVRGLTTAATLWATAAVGMAAGYGLYIMAVVTTLLLLVLLMLWRLPIFDWHEGHDARPPGNGNGHAGH
ncbi:MAG: MgtC/SapB family protein [Anaerolineae bacterium]|nr:MgtC/SapB family protein [Anaerolineae bacterium]